MSQEEIQKKIELAYLRGIRDALLAIVQSFPGEMPPILDLMHGKFVDLLDYYNKMLEDKRFIEFGGGGKMVTFKLWKGSELIKIQVNFVEHILFQPQMVLAKTLLSKVKLTRDERAYFKEFLEFYKPIRIKAYDEGEILCEKIRAILTRRA